MKYCQLILMAGIVAVVTCYNFNNIHPSAKIDETVNLGTFPNISDAIIEGNSTIGTFSVIGSRVRINNSILETLVRISDGSELNQARINRSSAIGSNNKIERGCNIATMVHTESNVTLHENVTILSMARIESNCKVGANSILEKLSLVGPNSVLGSYVRLGEACQLNSTVKIHKNGTLLSNVQVGNNSIIGANSFVGNYSLIGSDSLLGSNIHLGSFVQLGSNVVVRDRAVIENFVMMKEDQIIDYAAVVIPSLSLGSLYVDCMQYNQINQSDVELAEKAYQSKSLSSEFNERMNQLINSQFDAWAGFCSLAKTYQFNNYLQYIKSMYLMADRGAESFELTKRMLNTFTTLKPENFRVNGAITPGNAAGKKKMITTETRHNMIKLIAIELDSQRTHRVESESFCEFIGKIRSGERKVYYIESPITDSILTSE